MRMRRSFVFGVDAGLTHQIRQENQLLYDRKRIEGKKMKKKETKRSKKNREVKARQVNA